MRFITLCSLLLFFLTNTISLLYANEEPVKKDWVEWIIEQEEGSYGKAVKNDAVSEFNVEAFDGISDPDLTTDDEPYFGVDFNIQKMRDAIAKQVGLPGGSVYVLLLFSLAALLQMARVITGHGDWLSFSVRVIVVLTAIQGFPSLFNLVEGFTKHLSSSIMGGQSALDIAWSSQALVFNKIAAYWSSADDGSILSKVQSAFSKETFLSIITVCTYTFAVAMHYLIYLIQSCIIIVLSYFGPLIIALALIPETDFSISYISSVIQVFSWTIIFALLVKLMSTTVIIDIHGSLSVSEFIVISAMNFCYGLSIFLIPIISQSLFTGRGFAGLGAAGIGLGVATFAKSIRGVTSIVTFPLQLKGLLSGGAALASIAGVAASTGLASRYSR